MGELVCPLCCKETFSSRETLKHHLLGAISNLHCPSCDKLFANVQDLAQHLDKDCEDRAETILDIKNFIVKQEAKDAKTAEVSDIVVAEIEPPETEFSMEDCELEEGTFFCSSCKFNFSSLEDHLMQFHEGENVAIEVSI